MNKFILYLVIASFLVVSPSVVNGERLIAVPSIITPETAPYSAKPKAKAKAKVATVRNLKFGMVGNDVTVLQNFLIKKNVGPAAQALAKHKATGRYGELTKAALIEYQKAKGLTADGIAGPKMRAEYKK